MALDIADRLHCQGPKRMLALDGGGTRGIVSIAFLAEIERVLQEKLGRSDDFVLADYFDMIGGTSVGSILATLLALGWRVRRIEDTFREWSPQVFKPRRFRGVLTPRFNAKRLSAKRLCIFTTLIGIRRCAMGRCVACMGWSCHLFSITWMTPVG